MKYSDQPYKANDKYYKVEQVVFFDDRIKPEKLIALFNQYVYAHYDKKVMKECLSR